MRFSIMLLLILSCGKALPNGDTLTYYKENIYRFYDILFGKEENTVFSLVEIFGDHILEQEEFLFYSLCQKERTELECRDLGRRSLIDEQKEHPSVILSEYIKNAALFKSNYTYEHIIECVKDSRLGHDGNPSGYFLDVEFDKSFKVYFGINGYKKEEPFIGIFFSSGIYSSILYDSSFISYEMRLGVINDSDGYTNMRAGKGTNHKVIEKILETDIFDYYPTNESNWWKVKNLTTCNEGYVHNSRIKPVNLLDKGTSKIIAEKAKARYEYPRPCSN